MRHALVSDVCQPLALGRSSIKSGSTRLAWRPWQQEAFSLLRSLPDPCPPRPLQVIKSEQFDQALVASMAAANKRWGALAS